MSGEIKPQEIKETDEVTEFFGEPISIYTSAEAQGDGVLIAIDHPLINTVINYITRTVFTECIEPFVIEGHWQQFTKNKEQYEHILLVRLLMDIMKILIKRKPDWMHEIEVRGWKFWVVLNETNKYTVMFPGDY